MQGNKVNSVALMDGGVYDVQGTAALATSLAEHPRPDMERADMVYAQFVDKYSEAPAMESLGAFIVSDAPVVSDNMYPAPVTDDPARTEADDRLTLGHLNLITLALGGLALLMLVNNVLFFTPDLMRFVSDLARLSHQSGNQVIWGSRNWNHEGKGADGAGVSDLWESKRVSCRMVGLRIA